MQIQKSHKSEGIIITVVFHAALLLLFYFMVLRTPNPPLVPTMGGGGVDLNFGDPNAGTGDLDNLLPVVLASNEELNKETTEPFPEETTPEEASTETVSPTESEDAVEINAKEEKDKKPEVKKTETTKPTEKPTTEPKKEEKPKYNFPSKSSTTTSSSNASKGGENKNTVGNPGDPRGKDEKGRYLYGDPGSGGGKGGGHGKGTGVGFGDGYGNWKFVGNPIPTDESSEEGKVKFILTLDEEGNIVNAVAAENLGGVSPSVLRIYIQKLKTISVEAPSGYDITPGMKIPVWYTITAK